MVLVLREFFSSLVSIKYLQREIYKVLSLISADVLYLFISLTQEVGGNVGSKLI